MELYRRSFGYSDFSSRIKTGLITGSTLYFPFFLTQNVEDIGYYTDTKNPVYEIVDFAGRWDLSNTGVGQTPCLVLNNCTINFTVNQPISFNGASNGSISATIQNCPGPQTIKWNGPNGFTSTNPTISNLVAGNYTIKVTDNDCNMTYSNYFLTQPQTLTISLTSVSSQTNATTPGGCNGSAQVFPQGGVGPYTFTWYTGNTFSGGTIIAGPSTSLSAITNLCAGFYTVQVQDSTPPPNGPTIVSQAFSITEPQPISGTVLSTTSVTCNGGSDGAISVSASGGVHPTGYTFNLIGPTPMTMTSTGTATFNNLLTGNYTVQITDQVGNVVTLPVTVPTNTPVTVSVSSSNTPVSSSVYVIGCFDSTNGNINFSPNGGVQPYTVTVNGTNLPGGATYLSTNPNLTAPSSTSINGLEPGDYTVSNKDSLGCVSSNQTIYLRTRPRLNITGPTTLPNFNGYSIRCFSGTTGITFQTSYTSNSTTTTPTVQPIKYYLNGVFQAPAVSGLITSKTITLKAGVNTITAVNNDGCSATTVVTLTQPPLALSFVGTPNIDIINVNPAVCTPSCTTSGYGGVCQQAIVSVNGGVAPYNIVWKMNGTAAWGTGITSNPFCSTNPYTTLQVTVTDANGCTITSSINV